MSLNENQSVCFFVGCIAPIERIWPRRPCELISDLTAHFGGIRDVWSPTPNWEAPESYRAEMGWNLGTVVFVFRNRFKPGDLVHAKANLLEMEDRFSMLGHRRFNLNPGFIGEEGMFLASHKPGPFRSRLADAVWLERQLKWSGKRLVPLTNAFTEYTETTRLRLLRDLRPATPKSLGFPEMLYRFRFKSLGIDLSAPKIVSLPTA